VVYRNAVAYPEHVGMNIVITSLSTGVVASLVAAVMRGASLIEA
jgi:hypothetical protein